MTRILTPMIVVLCCLATQVDAENPLGKGVYIAELPPAVHGPPAAAGRPSTARVIMTANSRIYLATRVTVRNGSNGTQAALVALRARYNNIYAMAINTDGIARADTAVVRDGRVCLRARRVPLVEVTRLASVTN